MEKVYNKLVRDKIPNIIRTNGEEPITNILNNEDYKKELESKLYEEYKEVLEATNSDDRIEELADIIELIRSLAKLEDKTLEEVIEIANDKKQKRGGFEEKIFLEKVIKTEEKIGIIR